MLCGIEHAVKTALQNSGKFIPWQIVTISTDGKIFRRIMAFSSENTQK
jgi:hypothetical protein